MIGLRLLALGRPLLGLARRPRLLGGGLLLLALAGVVVHYAWLTTARQRAEGEVARLTAALTAARQSTGRLAKQLRAEQAAVREQATARRAAQKALVAYRRARSDAPSRQWAAVPIPAAERRRLCRALPGLDGCRGE